ncbi:hypothetical protein ACFYPN_23935 [Streptomyces sp. NPDC005576]|uniref:hypothetical protein n=1 Tax=unclassified Streptomyces TaxID=2593676 RepID=UPI0033F66455
MIAFWWVVVLVALIACRTAWRFFLRYPGGWTYAFHQQHRKDRQALDNARGAVRELRRTARRETWQAWTAVKRARSSYRREVRRAEAELQRLRTPHRGARIEQLGAITLHEHGILVGEDELPLAGVHVRFELARSSHVSYVYLTEPDGRERMERYDGEEFPEETVRRFSVRLRNAAVAAVRSREARAADIATAETALREAEEATEPMEVAQERLEETRERHESDPRLPRARAALDDARREWQDRTGRRPL